MMLGRSSRTGIFYGTLFASLHTTGACGAASEACFYSDLLLSTNAKNVPTMLESSLCSVTLFQETLLGIVLVYAKGTSLATPKRCEHNEIRSIRK